MFPTDGNSTSLNPEAPEFFPHSYPENDMVAPSHNVVNYSDQDLPNFSFFPAINQNPSSYYYYHCYSTSGPSSHPYPYYTDTDYQYPSNAQYCVAYAHNHNLLVSTVLTKPSPIMAVSEETKMVQAQDEPKKDMQQLVPARVSTGSKKRGESSRYVGSFNGREGRYKGHEKKHAKKEDLRAKSSGSSRNRERQYSSTGRNVRSCGGANSRQKHSVFPVLPDGQDTTVMIRNIPNRYTREMLMEFLDRHCKMENEKAKKHQNSDSAREAIVSAFDFLYLPIDFEREANKGYAFVNFTDARAAWKFYLSTNHQAWDVFQSSKIREIACARLQGKEQLVRHFEKSTFECDSDEYLPVSFSPARDGSRAMVEQRSMGRRISNKSSYAA
ncbi:PREDICTED: protein terminal ear1-like [Populus euphratica]|uniref:Protein terminal ear1-like n=1 Tax=Populus euphratica TaxID=75702 RepID=A0AAJ6TGM2_POPEU|nr:PREDICTED: protein terminal ear1-like [Populus euphratica]